MLQIIDHNNFREIVATDGYAHRLGTETYVKRAILLPNDTESDFEEVAELPKFTKEQYDAKVTELVRERYSADEEFAIQRKVIQSTISQDDATKALSEFDAYNAFVEECKERAKSPSLYQAAAEAEAIREEKRKASEEDSNL